MTRLVRRPRAASLLLIVLLTACSPGPDDTSSPESSPSPAAGSSPAEAMPTPTGTLGQGSADEQAAASAALAAYNNSWALDVQARRDPAAKSDWKLDYRLYFGEPALSVALGLVYGMRDAGLASPTGEPIRDPQVAAVGGQAQSAEIRDCVDFRPWPEIFVSTGQRNSIAGPPFVIEAQVSYDAVVGRWLVTEQTPHPGQPC